MSQPDEAAPEEAPRRPPREGLGFVLVKMGRAGPSFEPRRGQASLGTPVPRTPTLVLRFVIPVACTYGEPLCDEVGA